MLLLVEIVYEQDIDRENFLTITSAYIKNRLFHLNLIKPDPQKRRSGFFMSIAAQPSVLSSQPVAHEMQLHPQHCQSLYDQHL